MKKEESIGATAHALLGLLSIKPMSGYDMRQMVGRSIGHFWSESYGQIYPALKKMAAAGLVEKRTEVQDGRPDRHVYTLTEEGRERLEGWLEMPVKREVIRNELLLKLFFGANAGAGVSEAQVRTFLESQEREAKVFAGIAAQITREHGNDPQQPFWLITLSRGRHDALASIAWARETLAVLDGLGTGRSGAKNEGQRKGEGDGDGA